MEVNPNTLKLVRALVKLSSVITDIDMLSEDRRYKHEVKRKLNAWQEWIERYTKDSMQKLTQTDDETLLVLINMYDEFDERLKADDRFIAGMNIILAKGSSIMRDIEQMEVPYDKYVGPLRMKLQELLNSKLLRAYVNEEIIKQLISEMNDISDKMIMGTA
jgi:hypothetical protein